MECYNLFSGVELSMRSFFVISDTAGSGLQYFDKKQLFCSPQAKSVICETIIKKAECYVEICRDLLITLKVMGRLGGRV